MPIEAIFCRSPRNRWRFRHAFCRFPQTGCQLRQNFANDGKFLPIDAKLVAGFRILFADFRKTDGDRGKFLPISAKLMSILTCTLSMSTKWMPIKANFCRLRQNFATAAAIFASASAMFNSDGIYLTGHFLNSPAPGWRTDKEENRIQAVNGEYETSRYKFFTDGH